MSVRVIVCGSRRWRDRERIADRMFDLSLATDSLDCTVVHGGAAGADRIAHQEAQKIGLLVEEHDYRQFITAFVGAKRAPLVRNEHMASLGADLCLCFWDGQSTGSAHMMSQAKMHGIPVEVIRED